MFIHISVSLADARRLKLERSLFIMYNGLKRNYLGCNYTLERGVYFAICESVFDCYVSFYFADGVVGLR